MELVNTMRDLLHLNPLYGEQFRTLLSLSECSNTWFLCLVTTIVFANIASCMGRWLCSTRAAQTVCWLLMQGVCTVCSWLGT